VIEETYLVPLPKKFKSLGIWVEPLSVVEKAMEQLQHVQSRLPAFCPHTGHHWDDVHWGSCKKAVVIGVGPLGFLACALLIAAGVETYIIEVLDEDNPRVQLAKRLGAEFIDGKSFAPSDIAKAVERIDIVFEASGASALAVNFIPHLSRNAAYIMTGVPRVGDKEMAVNTDAILRQIVRHNMVILGSVNSNVSHFKKAIDDLELTEQKFGSILKDAITAKLPLKEYKKGFELLNDLNQVKVVFEI
jgi:threonine dehydrogenase-like Zn-dependent dehydrogenase